MRHSDSANFTSGLLILPLQLNAILGFSLSSRFHFDSIERMNAHVCGRRDKFLMESHLKICCIVNRHVFTRIIECRHAIFSGKIALINYIALKNSLTFIASNKSPFFLCV